MFDNPLSGHYLIPIDIVGQVVGKYTLVFECVRIEGKFVFDGKSNLESSCVQPGCPLVTADQFFPDHKIRKKIEEEGVISLFNFHQMLIKDFPHKDIIRPDLV